jgi:hypothetical protein
MSFKLELKPSDKSGRGLGLLLLFLFLGACVTQRPVSEMIFASAAMKAAERAGAERRSPDIFNRAQTAMWAASRLYLARDFEDAKAAAVQARRLAERAELEADLRNAELSR